MGLGAGVTRVACPLPTPEGVGDGWGADSEGDGVIPMVVEAGLGAMGWSREKGRRKDAAVQARKGAVMVTSACG